MSTPPPTPILAHPEPAPLSPRSALNTLAGHPDLDAPALRRIINGLARTIEAREHGHAIDLADLQEERDLLNDRVNSNTRQYFSAPDGYVANNGRLPQFTVPVDDGIIQAVRWVRILHDGRASGYLAEDNPSSDPYTIELYARPVDGPEGTEPMPGWFRRLLNGDRRQYNQLREAAHNYDADWGIHADIIRYRELDDTMDWLRDELDVVSSELRAATEARAACEDRLGAANASAHFAHLNHSRELRFTDEGGPRQQQRRRRRGAYGTRGRVN
jgi:hypothetical protein